MRFLLALLTLGLGALVIFTMVAPESTFAGAGAQWFPAEVGRGAERVDGLFDTINWIAAGILVLTFSLLAWAVLRGAGRRAGQGSERAGSGALEFLWTAVPLVILSFLTWAQLDVRAAVSAATADRAEEAPALVVEVEGAQFDWRFRYAGADGAFGTLDDVQQVFEMAVPIGRTVELHMRSADVIHSFFVPALRIKRDVVPGSVMPLRFHLDAEDYARAGAPGTLELRCAELCGWGHYAMIGRLRPMGAGDFESWLEDAGAARFASGNLFEVEPGGDVDDGEDD